MTEKEKGIIRGLLLAFLIVVVIPTFMFGYPADQYPSIGDWWTTGQAQLSPGHASLALEKFWGDDLIGNLFKNLLTLLLNNLSIPAWNALAKIEPVKYIILLILTGAIYDLFKTAILALRPKGDTEKKEQPSSSDGN
jgi:hypothetical protein